MPRLVIRLGAPEVAARENLPLFRRMFKTNLLRRRWKLFRTEKFHQIQAFY